jgi:hypothetical protein
MLDEVKCCHDAKTIPFVTISSTFTVNSRYKLLFKCSTIDYLPIILVVLEDGPLKSQNSDITLLVEGAIFRFLVLGSDVSTPCFDVCLQVNSGASMFHHL